MQLVGTARPLPHFNYCARSEGTVSRCMVHAAAARPVQVQIRAARNGLEGDEGARTDVRSGIKRLLETEHDLQIKNEGPNLDPSVTGLQWPQKNQTLFRSKIAKSFKGANE